MQAPEFWNHAKGRDAAVVKRTLLTPFSWLYRAGAGARSVTSRRYRPSAPVICVGNVTLGGAGKTPVTIALLKRLRARGINAHVISRGYGGRLSGPIQVHVETHTSHDVGDEPMLIAREGPTWIARNRSAGARLAARAGAEVIILDDGFQNPTIFKDLALVVVDPAVGFGNGHVFPAGPLRESVQGGLDRADAVIMLSSGDGDEHGPWRSEIPTGQPVIEADLAPNAPLPPGPVVAFAGIARPQKFFAALVRVGVTIKATATYPDHHPFTKSDIRDLREMARRHNALLITTEKDHVRLPPELRRQVHSWPVEAVFRNTDDLDRLVEIALDSSAMR